MSDASGFSLFELFRSEVETHAAALSEGLLALEQAPTDPARLESLMRAAHSIKGAARIVGLEPVVIFAHAMEDCFVAAQENKIILAAPQIDLLLRGVDFFSALKGQTESALPSWLAEQEKTLAALQNDFGRITRGEQSSAAAPSPTPAAVAAETALAPPATIEDNRVVRVAADTLDKLLGIAAETLVETSRLEPYASSLDTVRKNQHRIGSLLAELRNALSAGASEEEAEDLWQEIHQRLNESEKRLAQRTRETEAYTRRATLLTERLYREVITSRMRPFREGTSGFPRLVRDIARQLGKSVRLQILGGDTLVDRDSLEKLEAPLGHLIRNALDHGIESPDRRRELNKPPEGVVTLEARHHAGRLVITIGDDGHGIALDSLRAKAVEKNLVTPDMAQGLSQGELFEFLFLPGFTTSEQVTAISGRGVGLDVVRSTLQELGGSVRIESQLHRGTRFILELPVTRSVIRALLTTIGGEPYAFPLASIERTFQTTLSELEVINNRVNVRVDQQLLPLISASELLGLPVDDQAKKCISVVVIGGDATRFGLEVDRFIGESRVVVRPLDPRLGKIPDVNAGSVMEDGRALLILDVDDLVGSIQTKLSGGHLSNRPTAELTPSRRAKRVLIVDDSMTVRELERKLLEAEGYEVECVVDGMEGWNAARLAEYDLLISDVDMPRLNGIDLVRRIRQDSRLRSLPIVIVSYKDRESDRLRGLEAGANYYLTKSSFHDASFLRAVTDLIGEAHA